MTDSRVEPEFRDPESSPHDPYSERAFHRLTTIRSTSLVASLNNARSPLYLGRLASYFSGADIALPTRLTSTVVEHIGVTGQRASQLTGRIRKLTVNIFQLPSGRVVSAVTVDATANAEELIPILEDFYYESIEITLVDETPVSLHNLVAREIESLFPSAQWINEPDLHQLLFLSPELVGLAAPEGCLEIDQEMLRSFVYRVRTPQREGFTSVQFPPELNRSHRTIAAVGSFVSVLCGHQDYVENAAVISATAVVSATSELRATQTSLLRSYDSVRERLGTLNRAQRRQLLSDVSEQLARHEMNLSEHVESIADIGLWVPSLRIEDYHRSLVASVRMIERSEIISTSIQRLTSIANARTQVLVAEEQQLEDHRRRSWSLVVGLLTTITIPTSIVLAFFGASATEVQEDKSIFDLNQYAGVYFFAFGMVGLAIVIVVLFWVIGHPTRRGRD